MFKPITEEKVNFQIMNQIKENIKEGRLKKGDRLPSERLMAEQLGVSRATVREALRSLELMGLIKSVQGGGNYIPETLDDCLIEPLTLMFMLNKSEKHEMASLRRALEIEAVRLTAYHATRDLTDKLTSLNYTMQTTAVYEEAIRADKLFHREIAKASKNVLIYNMLYSLSSITETLLEGVWEHGMLTQENRMRFNVEHNEIIEALRECSPGRAVLAMMLHMDTLSEFV